MHFALRRVNRRGGGESVFGEMRSIPDFSPWDQIAAVTQRSEAEVRCFVALASRGRFCNLLKNGKKRRSLFHRDKRDAGARRSFGLYGEMRVVVPPARIAEGS